MDKNIKLTQEEARTLLDVIDENCPMLTPEQTRVWEKLMAGTGQPVEMEQ